jgi:DNA-binding response OmpR family regulator
MSQRILICDDEPHITLAVGMKLSKAGYQIEAVSDGQFAWEAIQRETPALVITDCQMPRMGGLELIEQMRSQPATSLLPVVMLTAKGFELDEKALAAELQVSHVVLKPFSPRALLQIVCELLGAPEVVASTGSAGG